MKEVSKERIIKNEEAIREGRKNFHKSEIEESVVKSFKFTNSPPPEENVEKFKRNLMGEKNMSGHFVEEGEEENKENGERIIYNQYDMPFENKDKKSSQVSESEEEKYFEGGENFKRIKDYLDKEFPSLKEEMKEISQKTVVLENKVKEINEFVNEILNLIQDKNK